MGSAGDWAVGGRRARREFVVVGVVVVLVVQSRQHRTERSNIEHYLMNRASPVLVTVASQTMTTTMMAVALHCTALH